MRIVVIGAVAAGTSAAAKARRNSENAEIVIYEKDKYISYSGCGMPYFIGGVVEDSQKLTPRDAEFFKSKYNIDIFIEHEVLDIDSNNKSLTIKNLINGEIFTDKFDKLIIAAGASPVITPIDGAKLENVFTLRNIVDMYKIKEFIDKYSPKKAVIIGTGFIGLELCENFMRNGIEVTLIEKLPKVTPGLDSDISVYVKDYLKEKGVNVITGVIVEKINKNSILLNTGETINSEIVILATGVKPNTELAKNIGIEIGSFGGIKVNTKMETSIKDIFACGDCIEQFNLVTRKPVFRPLGSTANKTGRIAGENVSGGNIEFRGVLGTGIFKVFDMTVASTGLSQREAEENGYDVEVCHNIKPNKPEYMGGKEMVIKAIANKEDGRLLGVQIVGYDGVDKRLDVFATAITFGAKVEDLFHLDLGYAPPFSTTKDPVMYTGMILDNAINKGRKLITPSKVDELRKSKPDYTIIDARVSEQYDKNHVEDAKNIPHNSLRDEISSLKKDDVIITYCNKGVTGNAAQNILLNNGFKEVYNLSGGNKNYQKQRDKE